MKTETKERAGKSPVIEFQLGGLKKTREKGPDKCGNLPKGGNATVM